MKTYESYKYSGVTWIGDIPNHWNVTRISRIFQIKAGGDAKPNLYSYQKDSDHPYPVYTNTKDPNDVYAYTSSPVFEKNTITVTGRGEIGLAIYRETPYDAIIRLLSLKPKTHLASKYHMYFINAVIPFTSDSAAIGQLSAVQLGPKSVCIPPISEQEIIVAYLDEKTSTIDGLVAQVEREIELLKEFKQAEIARVVTKGLHSNVPMKHSGITWIGDIPEHWDIRKLFQVVTSYFEPNKGLKNQNLLSLSYGSIIQKDINKTDGLLPASFETYQIIKPDIIVLRLTDLQNDHKSLRVGISKYAGIITSAYEALEVREPNIADYIYYQLHTNDVHKVFYGMGNGLRQNLNYDGMRYMQILVPPVEEQQEIVDYINRKTLEIDRLVVELTHQVEYLKEYKQRLIADVVTGKINVQPNNV